jgi:branched-chain amino acid transport system ATP-binding protein
MLEITDLTAGYRPQVDVLHKVSMTLAEGDFVAVLGANGAGKSSLARCISGVLRPRSGTITWRGSALRADPERTVRAGVVQIPEARRVFGHLSVLDNLKLGAFWVRSADEINRRLESVFSLFPPLKDRVQQPAGTLSGGQQQMLALARGMMAEPQLLIVDEPSLGLAPKLVQEVLDKLRELNAAGLTIVLIEQNAIALSYCARANVLRSGQSVASGTAESFANSDVLRESYL